MDILPGQGRQDVCEGNEDDRTITVSAQVCVKLPVGNSSKVLIGQSQMSVTSYNIHYHIQLFPPDILG